MRRKQNHDRLQYWQAKATAAESAYDGKLQRMDRRDKLYRKCREIPAGKDVERPGQTSHVRNICYELIESQVSSDIPQPKVTPLRQEDEGLAKLVEDMLRDELDRMRVEAMHDRQQRTVPIQGGAGWHVEWDNGQRTHTTVGEVCLSTVHPKRIIPQPGVTSDIEDMDYVFLVIPQTKGGIKRRYGVDVSYETEERQELRGSDADQSEDMVTQWIVYYRSDTGAIGRYSWVGNVELEDFEDYLARRLRKCVRCGAPEPEEGTELAEPTLDGTVAWPGQPLPEDFEPPTPRAKPAGGKKRCPHCGGTKWEEQTQDTEEIWTDIRLVLPGGGEKVIPGARTVAEPTGEVDMLGQPVVATRYEPTVVPFYKPDKYPILLQKNVSMEDSFLGSSDIDLIEDQQLTLNNLSEKILRKLDGIGTVVTLPLNAEIETDKTGVQVIHLEQPSDKQMIGSYTLQGDIGQDLAVRAEVYEEARQAVGVTDSFQGRTDPTATSGKAKEFSAAQSAGRMESKRIMENECWARIYELIFKLKLAFADEPRPVLGRKNGRRTYAEFDRYLFLEQDEVGQWYWNDRFLFSVDTAAPLAGNREAMWQETRSHMQSGAFGDPKSIDTLILYWDKMEELHYPGAGDIAQRLRNQQEAMLQAEQMRQQIVVNQNNQMSINQPPMEVGTPRSV